MKRERTASEQRFERYLDEHGYEFEHEADLGVRKRPDYLVRRGGAKVVCEVKEFKTTELHKRLKGAHGPVAADAHDVFGPIRRQVHAAARQLRPLKGREWPLVAVLANPGGILLGLDARSVAAALYGNPTVTAPVGPGAPVDARPQIVAADDGELAADHRYLSAVVVVHEPSLEQEYLDELGRSDERLRTFDEAMVSAQAFWIEAQAARDRGEVPSGTWRWLDVLHTISSATGDAVALPSDWFNAPGDVQWRFDAGGDATGARCP